MRGTRGTRACARRSSCAGETWPRRRGGSARGGSRRGRGWAGGGEDATRQRSLRRRKMASRGRGGQGRGGAAVDACRGERVAGVAKRYCGSGERGDASRSNARAPGCAKGAPEGSHGGWRIRRRTRRRQPGRMRGRCGRGRDASRSACAKVRVGWRLFRARRVGERRGRTHRRGRRAEAHERLTRHGARERGRNAREWVGGASRL